MSHKASLVTLLAGLLLPAALAAAEPPGGNQVKAILAPEGSLVDSPRLAAERRLNGLVVAARQGDGRAILGDNKY